MFKNEMTYSIDSLSDLDWETTSVWIERLRGDPDNELLFVEFEEWLGENPARAIAYRKIIETISLASALKRNIEDCRRDSPGPGG